MTVFAETRLSELSEIVAISRGMLTQDTLPHGELPVLSVADLRNGSPPRRFADRATADDARIAVPGPGDVLIGVEGGTVGESYAIWEQTAPFIPSQQAVVLRVRQPSRLDPWYLGAWLTTEPARERLRRLTRGAGVQRIRIKDLWSLTIPVPALEAQHEIGQRFLAFEAAITSHRAVAACLDELRALDLVVAFADSAGAS